MILRAPDCARGTFWFSATVRVAKAGKILARCSEHRPTRSLAASALREPAAGTKLVKSQKCCIMNLYWIFTKRRVTARRAFLAITIVVR